MADSPHSLLTGTDLHEPKGVASASSGTVYIADGTGSGAWTDISTRVSGSGITDVVKMTQSAYNALTPKVSTTLYVIVG